MEQLDRYVQAVKWWLPRAQRHDIAAELADDLQMQAAARAAALGRALTTEELEELLRQRGNPMLVALQYRPQRRLIGPVLYPVYTFVLKMIGFGCLLPGTIVWLLMTLFVPSYRHANPGLSAVGALFEWLWPMAWYAFAFVTLGFALIERAGWVEQWGMNWDVKKLPAVKDRLKIPRASTLGKLVCDSLFIAWWVGWFTVPTFWYHRAGALVKWAGGLFWESFKVRFFWPVLLLVLLEIALAAVNFIRPNWSRARLSVQLAWSLAASILVAMAVMPLWSSFLDQCLALSRRASDLSAAMWVEAIGNTTVFVIFVVVALSHVVYAGVTGWRLFRYPVWAGPGAGARPEADS
jgi:hypothetical protein